MNAPRQITLLLAVMAAWLGTGAERGFSQVVQLPSFRNFSVSTSAWVPDSGSTSLGGVGYASSGSTSSGWGPYSPRAMGNSVGGSSMSISAQIIDLQAMDEAILASASSGTRSSAKTNRSYAGTTSRSARSTSTPGAWQRVLAGGATPQDFGADTAETNVRYFLEKARVAENANRVESARVYYRMAVQAMTPQLIERYQRILAARAAEKEAAKAAEAKAGIKSF